MDFDRFTPGSPEPVSGDDAAMRRHDRGEAKGIAGLRALYVAYRVWHWPARPIDVPCSCGLSPSACVMFVFPTVVPDDQRRDVARGAGTHAILRADIDLQAYQQQKDDLKPRRRREGKAWLVDDEV